MSAHRFLRTHPHLDLDFLLDRLLEVQLHGLRLGIYCIYYCLASINRNYFFHLAKALDNAFLALVDNDNFGASLIISGGGEGDGDGVLDDFHF